MGGSHMADDITMGSRYLATARALDDCSSLARLARTAVRVVASQEPSVVVLAGGRRLSSANRVGLFAGSFNPLTRAHVTLVNAARRLAGLDVVVWACAAASVDKERVERAALVDRLAQMRAFVTTRRHEALVLLNRGLYIDEARILRTLLAPSTELTILVGFDKIVQIFDPRYYTDRDVALRALFALAGILVAPRGDDGDQALATLLAAPENQPFAAHVQYLDVPPIWAHDSSTEARTLATRLPPDVSQLTRLLPPVGVALALHTGAYRQVTAKDRDPYEVRVRWLDALALLPSSVTRALPPLATLVRLSLADDATGRRLQAWLGATSAVVGVTAAVSRQGIPDLLGILHV
jgi:nicotinamide-nucleotide adenylyltransferase